MLNLFGCMVFSDDVMREKLPQDAYAALQKTRVSGTSLPQNIAGVVADAMKEWALEKGATHYSHWFQPMTGITAEKHDSFISKNNENVIIDFSEKELVKGESDASSFPSGGIRATFEARGYTAWDPTSNAFIKDKTLCIPTAFYSYSGEVLDKKTPLLRSMQAINTQALRVLRLLGNETVQQVTPTVGVEQEYFLVDKVQFKQRYDLVMCGRTLFGAPSPKGQDMSDHYYGNIKPRVAAFMSELDRELWKLGVPAKTEHNEVAPAQHELAVMYSSANTATDYNQLTMELLKKVAHNHGFACLLHEKPFATVNGSGKHNNWSLASDTGANLYEPGKNIQENTQFLVFLCAVIKAVDKYSDLLRISAATAGNDCRLGGHEAPPAIISIFLGEELSEILEAIENGKIYVNKNHYEMDTGVAVLPNFPKDTTDRNRTSPFAFTGNKFEFRMVGSEQSVAGPNIVLNTIVADALSEMADDIEKVKTEKSCDVVEAAYAVLKKTIREHKRIVFNGNSYSKEWQREASERGLSNFKTTAEALPHFIDKKNLELFVRHNVFTENEMRSRYEILLEFYIKHLKVEASTMLIMLNRDILPSILETISMLCDSITKKRAVSEELPMQFELDTVKKLTHNTELLYETAEQMETMLRTIDESDVSLLENARLCYAGLLPVMTAMRKYADDSEKHVPNNVKPYPSYIELLYSI